MRGTGCVCVGGGSMGVPGGSGGGATVGRVLLGYLGPGLCVCVCDWLLVCVGRMCAGNTRV